MTDGIRNRHPVRPDAAEGTGLTPSLTVIIMHSRWLQRAMACGMVLGLAGCVVYDQPAPLYGGYPQPAAPPPYYAAPAPYAYAPYGYAPPAYIVPPISLGFGWWGGGHDGHRGR